MCSLAHLFVMLTFVPASTIWLDCCHFIVHPFVLVRWVLDGVGWACQMGVGRCRMGMSLFIHQWLNNDVIVHPSLSE